MAEQLGNLGLWSCFTEADQCNSLPKINENFSRLDAMAGPQCITDVLDDVGDLPVTGTVGDKYIINGEVHVWQCGVWQVYTIDCPFFYYDESLTSFFVYESGTITALTTFIQDATDPIGTIKGFDTFGGTLTIPNNYQICDGAVITDTNSPLVGQTISDLTSLAGTWIMRIY